jgi:small subunit ribosomal protein S3Ae
MFNEEFVAETPTTDPKSLLGRTLEVSVSELTKQHSKYYMKVRFKINSVDEKQRKANTCFFGYSVNKEQVYRVVRKHAEKIENVDYVKTKDNWLLQVTTVTILNRNAEADVSREVRKKVQEVLQSHADKVDIDNFVKLVINNMVQTKIKKTCSKIYPVRFAEVAKIEVVKIPE